MIEDITSVQILKEIKKYNAGIQVIIFSATNKVWNLLALQRYGADGFIIKEGPENSKDSSFTIQTIENFINAMSSCLSNRYKKCLCQIVSDLNSNLEKGVKVHKIDKDYQKSVKLFYRMAYSSLPQSVDDPCFDHSFMNYFRIIEATANELIDADNPEAKEKNGTMKYSFKFRGTDEYLKDYNEKKFSKTGKILSMTNKHLNFKQKFYNLFTRLGVYSSATFNMVEKRNALTHPNSKVNYDVEPVSLEDVLLAASISFQCVKKND